MMKKAFSPEDYYFMRLALDQARLARDLGEVPVGAVLVGGGRIIGRGHNRTEALGEVLAHAELIALSAASAHLGSKYLPSCTLYVTLEPCIMCAGALGWAQMGRIVFAASDLRRGYQAFAPKALHPKTKVEQGLLAEEAQALLLDFFKEKRGF